MRGTDAHRSEEIASSPGFTEDPFESMPRSQTPATPTALALSGGWILPSHFRTRSAFATACDFGAQSSRPASSLHTLRRLPVTRQTVMLVSRLPATALARRDLHPLGLNRKFRCLVYSSSSSALFPARPESISKEGTEAARLGPYPAGPGRNARVSSTHPETRSRHQALDAVAISSSTGPTKVSE